MDETIHIAIPAVGAAYAFYARVTAESARRGSSLPVVAHFIGEDDFKKALTSSTASVRSRITFDSFCAYHGSPITWSRLYLPELFPNLDWIISADADILFRGDIAELWKLKDLFSVLTKSENGGPWVLPSRDCPLPGKHYNETAIAWYRERGLRFDVPEDYFCAGLSLFNLKAMREGGWAQMRDNFLERFVLRRVGMSCRILERKEVIGVPYADQCALNYLLQDKKCLLPRQWGAFSGDENADIDWSKSGAVHFVEDMPWKRSKITHLESDLVVAWKRLANVLGGSYGWHNWRRLAFLFFKHNQWILKMHPKLWLHFRSTRGVRF